MKVFDFSAEKQMPFFMFIGGKDENKQRDF
jgi:hypothetical protein